MDKREVELLIISDIHLGTIGCHATELLQYLKSVRVKTLVLNGDIFDVWNFKKSYFPKSHLRLVQYLLKLGSNGTRIYYLAGNHDELLRKFQGLQLGNIFIRDHLELHVGGKKVWIFHGDVFDAAIQHTKLLSIVGGKSYDFLIWINQLMNWCLVKLGREKYSLSKKVKAAVKTVVSYISDFENIAARVAIEKGFDMVICGHIHQPQMREVVIDGKTIQYMNSGDWVESLSSLEYAEKKWSLFHYTQPAKDAIINKIIPMEPKQRLATFKSRI